MIDLPRYTIAKYIPDMLRNEPRNIGLLLWTPEATAARFLGERTEAPGEVEGTAVPPFVGSDYAYKEWVRYWRRELPKVKSGTDDPFGPMRRTGPGNFVLADDGVLTVPVPVAELPAALEHLFGLLVSAPEQHFRPATKAMPVADQVAIAVRALQLD